jgi:quinohemoprotein ethanol dehydrogenase
MKRFSPPRAAHGHAVMLVCASAMLMAAFNVPQLKAQENETNVSWRYYGNDLANTRFQNIDQVNTTNASQLKVAWVFHTGVNNSNTSMEMSPIVIGGTMFVTSGQDDVFALNAATGRLRWHYHPTDMPSLSSLPLCCSYNNRGVAYGEGLVFEARLDATLVALNAENGRMVWKTVVDDWHNGYSMTIAPQFINGMVIVGVSGGEYLTQGHVDAYNASTGAHIWRFYTTEPSTWTGDSYLHGGAPVWHNPTYDPALGTLYVTTGNAGPDINGVPRAGQNLYTVCILALNVKTGALEWYFQESHHDLWDYDATSPVVLFTLNGIPALAHQGKTGFTFILDRRNGTPLYPVTEVAVPTQPAWQNPWPTQPETDIESMTPHSVASVPSGYTAAPMWTPPQQKPLVMQPGADGGQEWPPDAYSPRTHFLYQHARYQPEAFSTNPTNTSGGTLPGWGSVTDVPPGQQVFGKYGAVDTTTGKIVWQITTPQPADSGFVVAGDVAFFGESNGLFHAVDAATGNMLWTFNAMTIPGAGGATAAPVAYEVNGREYIANGFGGNPGELYAPLGDAIIAFALPQ